MDRLWLDYRRPDPGRRRPGAMLLAAGVVVSAVAALDYSSAMEARDDAQATLERERQRASRESARRAQAAGEAEKAAARATTAPSAERWEGLFESLEAAADESVTLLSLHPKEKEIELGGEARDFPSAVAYVERLQRQRAIAGARLVRSEVLAENPNRPVRFALVADWRGAP